MALHIDKAKSQIALDWKQKHLWALSEYHNSNNSEENSTNDEIPSIFGG